MLSLLAQALPAAVANPTPPAWRVISKAAYFLGMMAVIGGSILHLIVLRPVLQRSSVAAADRAVLDRRIALVLAGAGLFFLVVLYFQFAATVTRAKGSKLKGLSYGDALSPAEMWRYITTPGKPSQWISTGAESAVQYGLWVIAAIVLMLLWSPSVRTRLTTVVSTALAITLVSHQLELIPMDFSTATADSVVDLVANHVHVIAVCTWIGGVATLVLLALGRDRLSENAGGCWAHLWMRFGTVALAAVGCLLISGLYMAWTLVGSPAELLTTKFGNVLLIKVALVAVILSIGASHEFVLMPRMVRARAAGDTTSMFGLALRVAPRLAAAEAVLALGALVAMTFLNGSARAQAGDADPTLSGSVIGLGVLFAAVLAVSFVGTAKTSEWLAKRGSGGPSEPAPAVSR